MLIALIVVVCCWTGVIAAPDLVEIEGAPGYSMYKCPGAFWLFGMQLCNGLPDCPNGEDEVNCETCPTDYHECRRGNVPCVWPYAICDGNRDCNDTRKGSDEKRNLKNCDCPGEWFQCLTIYGGQCIHPKRVCNGANECEDGSDELEENCPRTFQCANGTMIKEHQECDFTNDCGDMSDELFCDYCDPYRKFQCANGNCIWGSSKCADQDECGDGSGNAEPCECPSDFTKCANGHCVWTWYDLCDGEDDCGDNSDEEGCDQ